jgi:hypothetical protein
MIVFHIAFALVLAVLAVRALRRPGIAIAFILCMWTIKQVLQIRFQFFVTHSLMANALVACVAAASFMSMKLRQEHQLRNASANDNTTTVGLFLVLFAFLSLIWSNSLDTPVMRYRVPNSLTYMTLFVAFLPRLFTKEEDLYDAAKGMIWIGVSALVVLTFAAKWEGRQVVFGDPYSSIDPVTGAPTMLRGNPLEIAKSAGNTLMLLVLLNMGALGKFIGTVRWLAVLLAAFVMARTGSRGEILTTSLMLIAFFPLSRTFRSAKAMGGAVMALVGACIALYAVYEATRSYAKWGGTHIATDLAVRTSFARDAISAWSSSGIFRTLFGYGIDGVFDPRKGMDFPEVAAPALLYDLGLIGFVLWIIILVNAALAGRRAYQIVKDDDYRRGFVVALLAITCSYFIVSWKEGGYYQMLGWCLLVTRFERLHRAEGVPELAAQPALA